jgi:hypothetical protein
MAGNNAEPKLHNDECRAQVVKTTAHPCWKLGPTMEGRSGAGLGEHLHAASSIIGEELTPRPLFVITVEPSCDIHPEHSEDESSGKDI